ncbi:uncharacterized protein GGS22DRAFT_161846 [Annulohypoxylon maeteangense]|uniref:uncharacterized protein n=1 Tax=Annulohypoxylon maeteangense TaxID=1927788 RepID=UPI002007C6BA|nr:uncharacterized protein GGS22DRAFT_161846 [Annulohypoxylon maeteangense]KAI0885741.1 hypothetical protein GGS22DRAFT_161846 [Annulohypoxylon maeteangense]
MNHPSDSCIHPGLLTQAPDDKSIYCTLEPHFQPQPLPMEFTDSSLEYHQAANNVNPYDGQGSLADPDISRYMTLLGDLHFQQSSPIHEYRNDESQKPAGGGSKNHHENGMPSLKQEDITMMTHSRRSSRSSNKLTGDESSLEKRERNRKAANKCRRKQKQANKELKEKAQIMDEQHNSLASHKALLESEVIELKNELLIHAACGCEPISNYLMQAAKNYAMGGVGEAQSAEKQTSTAGR